MQEQRKGKFHHISGGQGETIPANVHVYLHYHHSETASNDQKRWMSIFIYSSSAERNWYTYQDLTWRMYPHPADSYKNKFKNVRIQEISFIVLLHHHCILWRNLLELWKIHIRLVLNPAMSPTYNTIKSRELPCVMNQQIQHHHHRYCLHYATKSYIHRPRKPTLIYLQCNIVHKESS